VSRWRRMLASAAAIISVPGSFALANFWFPNARPCIHCSLFWHGDCEVSPANRRTGKSARDLLRGFCRTEARYEHHYLSRLCLTFLALIILDCLTNSWGIRCAFVEVELGA